MHEPCKPCPHAVRREKVISYLIDGLKQMDSPEAKRILEGARLLDHDPVHVIVEDGEAD